MNKRFKYTALAIGFSALVAVPAMAEETKHDNNAAGDTSVDKDKTITREQQTDTTTNGTATPPATQFTVQPPATTYTVQPPATTYNVQPTESRPGNYPGIVTTPASTTERDTIVERESDKTDKPRVKSGFGLNVFGTIASTESAQYAVGGRLDFVMPFGLTLGGSFSQHLASDGATKSAMRPVLGEVGWAIPVVKGFEIRPMVGVGYAFVNADTTGSGGEPNQNGGQASASVATSGFDVAPGAKVSFVAGYFEVFTQPKYHVIANNSDFFALEVGAGARF